MDLKDGVKVKGKSITQSQRHRMVHFIRDNPGCNTGNFNCQHNEEEKKRVWEQMTEELNSMGGANKDWKGWQKVNIFYYIPFNLSSDLDPNHM